MPPLSTRSIPATDGVPGDLTAKDRQKHLGAESEKLAAKSKLPPQRPIVKVSRRPISTISNELTVTEPQNLANMLMMQYCLHGMSKDPLGIEAMRTSIERAVPDLLNMPSDSGLLAFHDFTKELTEEDVVDLCNSIKVRCHWGLTTFSKPNFNIWQVKLPNMPTLNAALVHELHSALRQPI